MAIVIVLGQVQIIRSLLSTNTITGIAINSESNIIKAGINDRIAINNTIVGSLKENGHSNIIEADNNDRTAIINVTITGNHNVNSDSVEGSNGQMIADDDIIFGRNC
jgi:hypothetical protein